MCVVGVQIDSIMEEELVALSLAALPRTVEFILFCVYISVQTKTTTSSVAIQLPEVPQRLPFSFNLDMFANSKVHLMQGLLNTVCC